MSIELQLTTGDEEWTFKLTEAVVPSPGDALTIDNPDGDPRDFRVVSRRITLMRAIRWVQSWSASTWSQPRDDPSIKPRGPCLAADPPTVPDIWPAPGVVRGRLSPSASSWAFHTSL